MKVFVYEYVSGGGGLAQGSSLDLAALQPEGRAMVRALAADFAALPGVAVVTLRDGRWAPLFPEGRIEEIPVSCPDEEHRAFQTLASTSTWTVLIAPETGGLLRQRAEWVLAANGRLLSPDPAFIALATDKHQTACHLERRGVPVPRGWLVPQEARWSDNDAGPCDATQWPWPVVVKPVDGCGSQGVELVRDAAAWQRLLPHLVAGGGMWRVEPWIEGLAASVGVMCGPGGRVALPACAQHLAGDGSFAYRGGCTPLPPPLDERARRLALSALAALPPACGYVGVDLVLGADPAGHDDRVIEVNPRLTTSYLGLRKAVSENLAGGMLQLARGQPWAWSGRASAVQFTADGHVRVASRAECT